MMTMTIMIIMMVTGCKVTWEREVPRDTGIISDSNLLLMLLLAVFSTSESKLRPPALTAPQAVLPSGCASAAADAGTSAAAAADAADAADDDAADDNDEADGKGL
jgi:hypothetical protein